jgi:transposase
MQFRQAEAQTRDGYELRRLQAIRLYGSGVRLADIMDMVGAGASSIRQWAMTYHETSYQSLLHQSGLSYQHAAKVYRSKSSAAEVAQFEAELGKK